MEMYIKVTPASVYSPLKSGRYCSHTHTYITPFLPSLGKLYINRDINLNSLTFPWVVGTINSIFINKYCVQIILEIDLHPFWGTHCVFW